MTVIERLWKKDATLWTNKDEAQWLGWLDIVERQYEKLDELQIVQEEFQKFTHVALLGMGGSSLCPEVLSKTLEPQKGFPKLYVLDSTNPDQIHSFEKKLDLKKTAFIVASKSGSTLEPNIFLAYFYELMKKKGVERVGDHFFAITDPESQMEAKARELKFKKIFYGNPQIGGRYSALSDFGIIPGLAMGMDVERFLKSALTMVHACAPESPISLNPGYNLGMALGNGALEGKDKISLVASPEFSDLPAWIEQLLAESTGKQGKGLIPVVERVIEAPEDYGKDRHFVYCGKKPTPEVEEKLTRLSDAGHRVTRVLINDEYDLGQEFFRWEVATAVAGSILKINPFDQPDVEAAKVEARHLTDQYEKTGQMQPQKPFFENEDVALYAKETYPEKTLPALLAKHFSLLKPNDYAALLGFIEMNHETEKIFEQLKGLIQSKTKAATVVEFGPRFLHSTGQAYKGGPNTGVFLQITTAYRLDLPVPGHKYSFGLVQEAQARGDFQVLENRGRRALHVRLKNPKALFTLRQNVFEAFGAKE